ncbi:MAG: hypothetical protein R2831_11000 [Chitinophagaceae bacterium]
MTKKSKKKQVVESNKNINKESIAPIDTNALNTNTTSFWEHRYFPYAILFIISFLLYSNTFKAGYALDDGIVICKNEYVLQGIKGIKSIFSKDLYASFYKQMNTTDQLSGGRYRPLSVVSFALEQELIGTMQYPDSIQDIGNDELKAQKENQYILQYLQTAWDKNHNGIGEPSEDIDGDGLYIDKDSMAIGFGLRHVFNALFYGLACCIVFLFLSKVVFKNNKWLAFAIALLFMAHPIHTEAVANVKSRDEIFSLLFMLLTLWSAFLYEEKRTTKYLILTALSFLCAMLSKEYGATLLVLVPMSLYLFSNYTAEKKNTLFKVSATLLGTFFAYFLMRKNAVNVMGKADIQDTEILNNPFLLANDAEKIATKFFITLKYLWVQLFPHPLSSDYGYNSIPYRNFSNVEVWLSILVFIAFLFGIYYGLKKKNWIAFALAFYVFNLLLVTNLVFNVGATMGERLAFHSSLGFCMLLGYGLYWLSHKMKQPILLWLFVIPIVIAYSIKTYSRNEAWQNDFTLALTDVKTQTESVMLNGNAASRSIDMGEWKQNKPKEKQYLNDGIQYAKKALSLHPNFTNGYLTLGLGYAKLEQFDSAKAVWDKAFKIYPSHPMKATYFNSLAAAYYTKGTNYGATKNWSEGKLYLQKAVDVNPNIARYWYDLGGFSYNSGDYNLAKTAWNKAYQLDPRDTNIIKVQNVFK